jgi:exonuclease III
MLDDFLRNQDIDIAPLQEVTHSNFTFLRRYEAHSNVGTGNIGTAILAKEGITLTNITRLPTGRGIAAYFEEIRIINIYAPIWGREEEGTRSLFQRRYDLPPSICTNRDRFGRRL